jgi:catechol 2,3-dioxygenase
MPGGEHKSEPPLPATPVRLPETTHVGAVRLQVSDLARSIQYYEGVLGLRVHRSEDGTARLGPQGEERTLVTLHTRSGITAARRGRFGLYHFAVLLPDRRALGRFASHVSRLALRVGTADHLVSEAIYLWDPDGLGIEVYADRPKDTWQHRNGELVMTTDPLDVGSLIASAGTTVWDGAPPGTTIGHVHLHVGQLETADAFYHRAIGLDKTVWSYPGALFMSAGGYHHHLGTNVWSPGPSPTADEAQLLEWELVVPASDDVSAVAERLHTAGYAAEEDPNGLLATDPWQTRIRIRADTNALS